MHTFSACLLRKWMVPLLVVEVMPNACLFPQNALIGGLERAGSGPETIRIGRNMEGLMTTIEKSIEKPWKKTMKTSEKSMNTLKKSRNSAKS